MSDKFFPLTKAELTALADRFPTPFYLYDEKLIREHARRFLKAFSCFPGFREYFAVKACPNPYILKILAKEGLGADCSSLPELILAQKAGITGEKVMFTSNETPEKEYIYANLMNAIINLDDITHIDYLDKALGGIPELICFRYNPGPLKEGNALIGKPEEAKYGLTRSQIFEAYAEAKKRGSKSVVRREVVRLVTPGTLTEDALLEARRHNYLAAWAEVRDGAALAWADISTGEMRVMPCPLVRRQ